MTLLKKVSLFNNVGLFIKVGLIDIRLGPELVVNGNFDTDLAGWTPGGIDANNTITWVAGEAYLKGDGSTSLNLSQYDILTISKTYKIVIKVRLIVDELKAQDGGGNANIGELVITKTYQFIHEAVGDDFSIFRKNLGVGVEAYIDNVSVREIL